MYFKVENIFRFVYYEKVLLVNNILYLILEIKFYED